MPKIDIDPQGRKKLEKFGKIVRKLREERGWTLLDTESHGFKSWKVLQRIESGKHNVSLLMIIELGRLFRIHPAEILAKL